MEFKINKESGLEKISKESGEGGGNGCCCGCCIGIAIGYAIFGGQSEKEFNKEKDKQDSGEVVKERSDNIRSSLTDYISNYQENISPKIKEDLGKEKFCKFEPSCSEYAKQSIEKYGSLKWSLMASERLLRCNPLSKGGYDPLE